MQDISITSRILGHTNVITTMAYVNQDLDTKKEVIKKLTNHILALKEYDLNAKYKTA